MSKAKPQAEFRDRIKELRRVKASDLLPNPANPRRHPESQASAVAGILAEIGYADALLARETPDGLVLIDGHLRQKLTPDAIVPVLVLDVSEAEANLLLASIDPLSALAEYDKESLDKLLHDVSTGDAALAQMLSGLAEENGLYFGEQEKSTDNTPDAEPDKADELQAKWRTEYGQIWIVGSHRIMCGDSTNSKDVDELIDRNWPQGIVTDPPYELSASEVSRACESFADIVIMLASDSLAFEFARYWQFAMDFIWKRRQPRMFPGKNRLLYYHSHCVTFKRTPSVKTGWESPRIGFGSIIEIGHEFEDHEMGHGKHPELFQEMLAGFKWQVVADPFLGTGASLLACEAQSRVMLGMELNPKTLSVALERFERAGLEPKLLASPELVHTAKAQQQ